MQLLSFTSTDYMNCNGNFLEFNSQEDDKLKFSTLPILKVGEYITVYPNTVKKTQYTRIGVNVSSKPAFDFTNQEGAAYIAPPSTLEGVPGYEYRNLPNFLGKCYKVVRAEFGDKTRKSDSTLYKGWIYEFKEEKESTSKKK